MDYVLCEYGETAEFHSFGVKVMFRESYASKSEVLSHFGYLDDFVEHPLYPLSVMGDGS